MTEASILPIRELWVLAKESVRAWLDDYAMSLGAAIAFYTIFSLAPILIIVIFVAGLVFGEDTARIQLMSQISEFVGEDAAAAVEGVLEEASRPGRGVLAFVLGLIAMVIGATTVFTELRSALNRIWQVPDPPEGGIWQMLWSRVIAFILVLGIAGLLLGLVALSAVISALGDVWSTYFGGWSIVLRLVDFVASFAILTTILAFIYRFVPHVNIAWSDVWLGAGVTATLFMIGRYLIGLYLGTAGIGSGFGAAGSLVVLLMWVYYSAQIFLLGAEFTWVYAHRHGSRAAVSPPDRDGRAPDRLAQPLAAGVKLVGVVAAIGFVIGMITRR